MSEQQTDRLGKGLAPGSHHYRAFVGSPEDYDVFSAMQFNLLTSLGLREHHFLLDIGCGSLRAGKLFIPYLLPGHYFSIEPERWLIEEGIRNEIGKDMINLKAPVFSNDSNFTCTVFNQKFDFIVAQSIFTHASQAQISRCISQVKECMKPTSIFAANFWKGHTNYTGNEWDYSTCITYTLERIIEFANAQGLICQPIDYFYQPPLQWVLIFYPENEEYIPDLSDVTKLDTLEKQLNFYRNRISMLECHPYVRFGSKINRTLKRIKLLLR